MGKIKVSILEILKLLKPSHSSVLGTLCWSDLFALLNSKSLKDAQARDDMLRRMMLMVCKGPRKEMYRLGWRVGDSSTIMVGGGEVCLAKWPN